MNRMEDGDAPWCKKNWTGSKRDDYILPLLVLGWFTPTSILGGPEKEEKKTLKNNSKMQVSKFSSLQSIVEKRGWGETEK